MKRPQGAQTLSLEYPAVASSEETHFLLTNNRKDRLTIQQREMEEERQRELEGEKLKAAEERKKYTIKVELKCFY